MVPLITSFLQQPDAANRDALQEHNPRGWLGLQYFHYGSVLQFKSRPISCILFRISVGSLSLPS